MVATYSKIYTLSTLFFNKYLGANVGVTNCMSQFCMFVPTKANVKLTNVNTVHAQGIRIILYSFPKFPIIYPVVTVYYCPGHPYNTISLGDLKFYVCSLKFKSEPL